MPYLWRDMRRLPKITYWWQSGLCSILVGRQSIVRQSRPPVFDASQLRGCYSGGVVWNYSVDGGTIYSVDTLLLSVADQVVKSEDQIFLSEQLEIFSPETPENFIRKIWRSCLSCVSSGLNHRVKSDENFKVWWKNIFRRHLPEWTLFINPAKYLIDHQLSITMNLTGVLLSQATASELCLHYHPVVCQPENYFNQNHFFCGQIWSGSITCWQLVTDDLHGVLQLIVKCTQISQ